MDKEELSEALESITTDGKNIIVPIPVWNKLAIYVYELEAK